MIISSTSLARFRNGCGEHQWMNLVLSLACWFMEDIQSLYKMDETERLVFPAVMAKYCFQFLLSMIRFDNKTTRTGCRLEDNMAAFREICDMFVGLCKSLYLVGSAVCIDEYYLHSEEDVDSGNICRKNQASTESKFG
jgi:hypothetical protein